ncbi:MAG: hypothetical protein KDK39_09480 [Leptospiraceae bacterium]|nr:hypothetical protein [Leptospiraceae bacterium]
MRSKFYQILFLALLIFSWSNHLRPEETDTLQNFSIGLAADKESAIYRTGKIDSRVIQVPDALEQKAYANPKQYLQELTDFLTSDTQNQFLKIKRIHDWITLHIAYDNVRVAKYLDSGLKFSNDIQHVLKTKRTECGGYSKLFMEMSKMAGIESVSIHGYQRRHIDSSGNHPTHIWNAVKIRNKFYIVDVSRDRRFHYIDSGFEELGEYTDYELFLHPEAKLLLQAPNDPKFLFLKREFSRGEVLAIPFFEKNYLEFQLNYGVTFIPSVEKMISRKILIEEKKIRILYDLVEVAGRFLDINIEVDKDTEVLCTLRDAIGKHQKGHFSISRKKNTYNCRLSFPDNKIYTVDFYARNFKKGKNWVRLYQFKAIYKPSGNDNTESK